MFTALLLADISQRTELALTDPIGKFLPSELSIRGGGGRPIVASPLAIGPSADFDIDVAILRQAAAMDPNNQALAQSWHQLARNRAHALWHGRAETRYSGDRARAEYSLAQLAFHAHKEMTRPPTLQEQLWEQFRHASSDRHKPRS